MKSLPTDMEEGQLLQTVACLKNLFIYSTVKAKNFPEKNNNKKTLVWSNVTSLFAKFIPTILYPHQSLQCKVDKNKKKLKAKIKGRNAKIRS